MLACIACSKPEDGGGEASGRGNNKDAVKSLTSQIKDMVLKFSGAHRQSKGGGPYHRKPHHHGGGGYMHRDNEEEGTPSDGGGQFAYLTAGSSSSTPAWDFTTGGGIAGGGSRFQASKWAPGIGEDEDDDDVALENSGGGNGESKEWMAQVEPGVHITFVSLHGGAGNDLKRIRFSREMFNKWQAQRWWGENYDRIMELYNVQRFNRQSLPTPPRSDDGQRESFYSRVGSTRESPGTPLARDRPPPRNVTRPPPTGPPPFYLPSVPDPSEHVLPYHLSHPAAVSGRADALSPFDAVSRTTTSSRDDAASISISNASEMETTEWVEQDEPGVYITIRELHDGTRELRRVRFSREKFGEVHAKLWWEENRERIQAQYL